MISKWRSIRLVEINQYDITVVTHFDITMGNNVARDVHCKITIGNDVDRDVHCDITMGNDVAMCTYHAITKHNNVAMNIFYSVFSALILIVLFYYGYYGIKTSTSSCLISLCWRTHSLFMCRAISLVLCTCEISLHKHNLCVLPRLIKRSLVLVILTNKELNYITLYWTKLYQPVKD